MDFASDRYDASSAADYDANLDANTFCCFDIPAASSAARETV